MTIFQQLADLTRALVAHLLSPGDSSLVQAHAQIMATLVTLLLTLLLIPVQQASSQYSSALLRYFRDDRKLRGYLLLLLVLLAIVIVFMLMAPLRWIDYAASASVVVSFGVLVLVIDRITTMLDVTAFLLPELKQRTQKHLDAAFRAVPDTSISVSDNWKEAFEEGSDAGEFAEYGETRYKVRIDVQELQQDVLVWKTLGIRLAGAGDYQAFERLVTGLGDITRRYLDERREYRTANDSFLRFLAETFDHLARSAESQPNETFSDVLFRTVTTCAEAAVVTNPRVLGAGVGDHRLAMPFSRLLKQHAWRARETGGRTRAYEAIHCYSRVGVELASRGYGLSAVEVAAGTLTFALEDLDKGDTYFFTVASTQVPQILFLTALHSRVYALKNPYSSIYALISMMLKRAIARGHEESMTQSLIARDSKTHVSRICMAALFAPDTKEIADANVTLVDHVLDAIVAEHIGAGRIEWELTLHVYQIGVLALAALHREVFDGLTLSDASAAVLQVPRDRVAPLFVKCVRHLVAGYGSALTAPSIIDIVNKPELERTFIHHEGLVLRSLLSLLYLGVHIDRGDALGLRTALERCTDDLAARIAVSQKPLAGDQIESLELFAAYLKQTGVAAGARVLVAGLTGKKSPESYKDSAVLRALEEPLMPLKHEAVNTWNLAIFGPAPGAPPPSPVM